MDFDALGTVMLKKNRGIELSEADVATLRRGIEFLEDFVPELEPDPELHSRDATDKPGSHLFRQAHKEGGVPECRQR